MQPTFQRFPQLGRGTEANPYSRRICVQKQKHKYKSYLGLPPSLASAEENVERLAAFYYRGSLTAPWIQNIQKGIFYQTATT